MDYFSTYAGFLERFLRPQRPVKAVFDCSNGTVGLVLKKMFAGKQKSVEALLINDIPDGNFPAHGPNPLANGALKQLGVAVRSEKADFGAVFDADGDRVFFVDDLGWPVRPAAAIALLAGGAPGGIALPVNIGPYARRWLEQSGKKIVDSRIGHFFIKKLMKEKGLAFAAEQSGHYYFREFFDLDSGIFAVIQMVNVVSGLDAPLSDWLGRLPAAWVSEEINFETAAKEKTMEKIERHYQKSAVKTSRLDGLSMEFADWWFNLRPSNTENLLRLNLEANSREIFAAKLKELTNLLSF